MKKKCRGKATAKVLGSLLVGLIVLTMSIAHTPALAELSNYSPQGLNATTLEEVLALPDEEIDLATAILIIYKEWDANFNIEESLREIDRMAVEIRALINNEDDPKRIVSLINHYLFENKGYTYVDYSSQPGFGVLEQKALSQVIENRKGDCFGLSLLYLALTERLELPFYGVALPDHFFVRYANGEKRINVETTSKGVEVDDREYEEEYEYPNHRKRDFYLRSLSKKEVIGGFLHSIGMAYGKKGMYDEAIIEYRKAIELNPNYTETHDNLGMAYGKKGMYDEAIIEYKKAIEINPDDNKAYNNLGVAYERKGMLDEAIDEYKKAIELNPNDAEPHGNLGMAYGKKGMYDEAIAEYKKAIEINPDNDSAHYNLGVAYERKGMLDEATVEYRKAVMYDKIIIQYKEAIEVNPKDDLAHYNFGTAYYDEGMYDEAIVEFMAVIEINLSDAEAHFMLGETYYRKGEYSLAIEHYNRAMELGSSVDPTFLELLEQYKEE